MTILDTVALFLGLIAALTMWGVSVTIRHHQRRDPTMRTSGARFAQWLHVFWSASLVLLAVAVVYG